MPRPDSATPRPRSTRRDPVPLLVAAAVLLVLRVALGVWEARHPTRSAAPPAGAELVTWHPIEGAEDSARVAGRPVLYDFTADWCGPCQMMKREVFADEEAARFVADAFYPVRVLDRSREEGRNPALVDSLERRFRIEGFPTLVVVGPGGEPVVFSGYSGKRGTIGALRSARIAVAARPGR